MAENSRAKTEKNSVDKFKSQKHVEKKKLIAALCEAI